LGTPRGTWRCSDAITTHDWRTIASLSVTEKESYSV
jgi:hypothetical protein